MNRGWAQSGAAYLQAIALTCLCAVCLCFLAAQPAHADEPREVAEIEGLEEVEEVHAQIDAEFARIDELGGEIKATEDRIKSIEADMKSTLKAIDEKQAEYAKFRRHMSDMAVELYKDHLDYSPLTILESEDSLMKVIWRLDMRERVIERYQTAISDTQSASEQLQKDYEAVSKSRDEQRELIEQMNGKIADINKTIDELRKREKVLGVKEKAKIAQASAQAQELAETFETGSVGDDTQEWKTGLASAYGGSSDDITPKDELTATGTICDDWSIGVAVPLAWGPSAYYGRYVEISYEGRSIVAPVVDCGDMDGGNRALDLQPGVFKAFGCATGDEWGVREVQYRFI